MKTRQVWTPYRDEILRKRYPKEGASEALCGLLGCTLYALQNRAYTLRLKRCATPSDKARILPGGYHVTWTAKEDAVLREKYPTEGASANLMQLVGRSAPAISAHARKLGLYVTAVFRPRYDGWTTHEDKILKTFYPIHGLTTELKQQLPNRSIGAIHARSVLLRLVSPKRWTGRQENILRARYVSEGASVALQTQLRKSAQQLRMKAFRLGLKTEPTNGESLHLKGASNPRFTGHKTVTGNYMWSLKNAALTRELKFLITARQVWECWSKQRGVCALTGIPVSFSDKTASVDRVDSTRGYHADNIQITHKRANIMKMAMTDAEFRHWCSLVVNHLPAPISKNTKHS